MGFPTMGVNDAIAASNFEAMSAGNVIFEVRWWQHFWLGRTTNHASTSVDRIHEVANNNQVC